MTAYSETLRQVVHIAMVGFAFLLRYLTWPQAALLAFAALVFNATLLARVSLRIVRPTDAGGHRAGIRFYPLSILLLILVFRERLDLVAAAWAVMAFGDGAATLAGTRRGGRHLPWNPEKTWSGLVAFVVAASTGAIALSVWVAPSVVPMPPGILTWLAPLVAALVAAIVETVPIKLDDNLSVPFAAGLTLALGAAMEPAALQAESVHFAHRIGWAVFTSAAMSLAAWKVRSATVAGAAAGTVVGAAIFVFGGFQAWLMLLAASAVIVTCSRAGKTIKRASRGLGSVIATGLVGLIGAWLMAAIEGDEAGALILTTGLAAGASASIAGEVGRVYGRGGGMATSVITAIAMAALFALLFPFYQLAPLIVFGVAVGSLSETALDRRFKASGVLNPEVIRFVNTFVAASGACAGAILVAALVQ